MLIPRVTPNGGKIFFDGTELSDLSHRDTALKMAVVAQHSTVNFDFSVLEMVLMGRSLIRLARPRSN